MEGVLPHPLCFCCLPFLVAFVKSNVVGWGDGCSRVFWHRERKTEDRGGWEWLLLYYYYYSCPEHFLHPSLYGLIYDKCAATERERDEDDVREI